MVQLLRLPFQAGSAGSVQVNELRFHIRYAAAKKLN